MDNSTEIISTKLVEKVQKLAKKPSLDTDIQSVLLECLKNMEKQYLYLSNGIFNFNFAEMAIILEHVTAIFGKKVDLLWDCLLSYQKGLLKFNLDQEKTKEEEKIIDSNLEKYKRKRRKPPETAEERPPQAPTPVDLVTILPQLDIECDPTKLLSLQNSVSQYFSQFPSDPEEEPYVCREHPFLHVPSSYEIKIDDEYSCSYNQLLSNRPPLDGSDYGRQILHEYQCDTNLDMISWDIEEDLMQAYILENDINLSEITEEQVRDLLQCVSRQLFERTPLHQKCKRLCPRRSSILLTRLADHVVQKYLKKDRNSVEAMSTSGNSNESQDSGFDDMYPSDADENDRNNEAIIEHLEVDTQLVEVEMHSDENDRTTKEECSVPSESSDSNNNRAESTPNKTFEQTIAKHKEEREKMKRPRRVHTHDEDDDEELEEELNFPKRKRLRTIRTNENRLRKVITKPLDEFEMFFCENYRTQIGEGQIVISSYLRAACIEKTKAVLLQKAIRVSLKEFEIFVYRNYTPEDDEGIAIEPFFPDEPQETNLDADIDTDSVTDRTATPSTSTERHDHLDDSGIFTDISSQSLADPCEETTENSPDSDASDDDPPPTKSLLRKLDDTCAERQQAREKYTEWETEINDKLKRTNKQDFDIHLYESKIIDAMSHDRPVEMREVMSGKNGAEVCRLFTATLQLVNDSNIEFLNYTPGVLANDTLQMRLVNKDRHHEHLVSYQAPSIGDKAEALKRIKTAKYYDCRPSTSRDTTYSSSCIPHKKRKYCK